MRESSKINVFRGEENDVKSKNLILAGKERRCEISAPFSYPKCHGKAYGIFIFYQVYKKCIERGEKSKVFLHIESLNQVPIVFPTCTSK